jgi:hypothetical protein
MPNSTLLDWAQEDGGDSLLVAFLGVSALFVLLLALSSKGVLTALTPASAALRHRRLITIEPAQEEQSTQSTQNAQAVCALASNV